MPTSVIFHYFSDMKISTTTMVTLEIIKTMNIGNLQNFNLVADRNEITQKLTVIRPGIQLHATLKDPFTVLLFLPSLSLSF